MRTRPNQLKIALHFAENKKIQKKDPQAFTLINSIIDLNNKIIPPGQQTQILFETELDHQTKVTEKNASPYLTLSLDQESEDESWPLGVLQITIKPHLSLQKTIEIIERFHRFTEKGVKNKKNGVGFKLIPPNAKEMGHLVQLDLEGNINSHDDLELVFNFKTNKVNMDASTLALKKEKSKAKLTLGHDEYLYGKNQINQNALLKKINEVFQNLKEEKALFK